MQQAGNGSELLREFLRHYCYARIDGKPGWYNKANRGLDDPQAAQSAPGPSPRAGKGAAAAASRPTGSAPPGIAPICPTRIAQKVVLHWCSDHEHAITGSLADSLHLAHSIMTDEQTFLSVLPAGTVAPREDPPYEGPVHPELEDFLASITLGSVPPEGARITHPFSLVPKSCSVLCWTAPSSPLWAIRWSLWARAW